MRFLRADSASFASLALRERAATFSSDEDALIFRVMKGERECALVVVRLEDGDDVVDLEEIFVAPELRHRGVGRETLAALEGFARENKGKRLRVWAVPLGPDEDDDDKIALIDWYARRGFQRTGAWDELEKLLPPESSSV
jgi:GNAT superfamily N-acetyltransferase